MSNFHHLLWLVPDAACLCEESKSYDQNDLYQNYIQDTFQDAGKSQAIHTEAHWMSFLLPLESMRWTPFQRDKRSKMRGWVNWQRWFTWTRDHTDYISMFSSLNLIVLGKLTIVKYMTPTEYFRCLFGWNQLILIIKPRLYSKVMKAVLSDVTRSR